MRTRRKHGWSEKEKKLLVDEWIKETSIKDIAAKLDRREAVVRAKVSHLRRDKNLKKLLKKRLIYENYKLTALDIPKIRKDKRTLRLIGEDYGVSSVTIYKIKNRETWKNA